MQVNFNSNTNFKAEFIAKNKIKQKIIFNNYFKKQVSFIQIDMNSRADLIVLEKISKNWGTSLATNIISYVENANKQIFGGGARLFAITKQKDDFKDLKEKDILSLAVIVEPSALCKNDKISLEILQTNPKYINDKANKRPKYKHCGSAIIDSIKKYYNKRIETYALEEAVPFYKKNDFKIIHPQCNMMEWNSNNNS